VVTHLRQDHLGWEDHGPCGGQFDGQRQTVNLATDLCHHVPGCGIQGEGRAYCHRAVDEQSHGVVLGNRVTGCVRGRDRKRLDGQHLLDAKAQRRATGRQHLHVGAIEQQERHEIRRSGQQMLTVVEQQHDVARLEGTHERVFRRFLGRRRYAQCTRDGGGEQRRVIDCRQIDPDHATGPRERQQGHGIIQQEPPGSGTLCLPADEARAKERQHSRLTRCADGSHACPQPKANRSARSVPDSVIR
jgi:hypothetical protein